MATAPVAIAPIVEAPLNSTSNGTDAPHAAPHGTSEHGGAWGTQPLRPPFDLWLIQVLLIMVLARVLAFLLKKVKQPSVIAEVIAGIILGPSVLGFIPNYINTIFPASSMGPLTVTANIGLILFMFLVGIELDFDLLRRQLKTTIAISIVAIVVPFAASVGVAWSLYVGLAGASKGTFLQFALFLGVAMSITAFPVLARIIKEKHLLHTRVGMATMSTAAWNDVVAWCILPFVLSVITGQDYLNALWTVISLVVYVLVMFFGGRRFFAWLFLRDAHLPVSPPLFAVVVALVFVNSWVTDYIGLHSIFGAFIFGIVLPREGRFLLQIAEKMEDLVLAVFLPIYFVFSGLKTSFGSLDDGPSWGFVVLVCIVAAGTKIIGGALTARVCGMTWRESLTLGVMMNAKGLVELIVLNIGYDYGIISSKVFTIMVIMALVTTFITSPLVHFLFPLKRILEFESATAGKQSLLLTMKDRSCVTPFITLIDLFTRIKPKKWKIYGLRLVPMSDRPSTYMATSHPDDVLKFAEDSAKLLNLKLKPTPVVHDDSRDARMLHIVSAARKHNAHYVFMNWHPGASDTTYLGSETIGDVMRMISCNAAILLDRGLTHAVSQVTFIYSGGVHDLNALKLIRAVAKSMIVKLNIIIPEITDAVPHEVGLGQAPPPSKDDNLIKDLKKLNERDVTITVISSRASKINKKILLELSGGEGQLLIFGCAYEWTIPHPQTSIVYRDIAMGCPHTVLIVSKCDGSTGVPTIEEKIALEPSSPNSPTSDHSDAKKQKKKKRKGKDVDDSNAEELRAISVSHS